MATLPESPEDEELAEFLQRNVSAEVVDLEKGEVVEKEEEGGKKDEKCVKEDEEEVEKKEEEVKGEVMAEVKQEVKEEPPDEWSGWFFEGAEEEDEFVEEQEEVPSPKTPGEEGGAEDEWSKMGLNKPPDPPKIKTRGSGATKRRNSNFRQNQRNLAKRIMNQRHGASAWWSSSSSSSSWRGWHGWRGHGWDDGWPQDAWRNSQASSSTARLLEKALDKIPDAR